MRITTSKTTRYHTVSVTFPRFWLQLRILRCLVTGHAWQQFCWNENGRYCPRCRKRQQLVMISGKTGLRQKWITDRNITCE